MISELSSIGDGFRQLIAIVGYHLPRSISFMLFFPLFTFGINGAFLKLSIAVVIVLIPAFTVTTVYTAVVNQPIFNIFIFGSEVILGTLLGLTIALPYFAFRGIGAMIDVHRGATFSGQVTGNESGEQLPFEQLFAMLYTAIIMVGPGFQGLTNNLIQSYLIFPPGQVQIEKFDEWLRILLGLFADHILFAVLISMPTLIIIIIVELIVEILSIFTQELQVYSVQFGLKSLLGILGVLLTVEFAEEGIFSSFNHYTTYITNFMEVSK